MSCSIERLCKCTAEQRDRCNNWNENPYEGGDLPPEGFITKASDEAALRAGLDEAHQIVFGVPSERLTATEVRTREQRERLLTIIESPFAGDPYTQDRNLIYLRAALRDSWERAELPFASHAFFPFFLRESDPEERKAGIESGYWFWRFAGQIAFYTDYGVSPGMAAALSRCRSFGKPFELRTLKVLP